MVTTFIYKHDDKEYLVTLSTKKMKTIRYKYRDGSFYVSGPYFINKSEVIKGLDKFYDRLTKENPHFSGLTDDYVYLLGMKIPLQSEGKILFNDGSNIIYEDRTDLEKKLKKWFLKYVTYRTRLYEKKMSISENKVRVRKMYTRYGSNSISHRSITYSLVLMHYTVDVIDSVVVHELAHCKISNHGPKFYKLVYKYCPDYDNLRRRLIKGIYQND